MRRPDFGDVILCAGQDATRSGGVPTLSLAIPVSASLVGAPPLLNQAVVIDLFAGSNPVSVSNRGEAIFGML